MTAHSTLLTDAAQLLCDAQSSGIPIQPLTHTYPDLDVAQAYSVQRLNLDRYIGQGRARAPLRGPGVTAEDVMAATGQQRVAVRPVDKRSHRRPIAFRY